MALIALPACNDDSYEAFPVNQQPPKGHDAEALFLAAWKQGVKMAGAAFFKVTAPSVARAESKWELVPDVEGIRKAIGLISRGEGAFLAAMTSFYNARDGQTLLESAGYPNICDLAAKLDPYQGKVIAALFLSYRGW